MSLSQHHRHAHGQETLGITQSSTFKVQRQSIPLLHRSPPPQKKVTCWQRSLGRLSQSKLDPKARIYITKVNGCQCSRKPNLMEKRWSNQSYVRSCTRKIEILPGNNEYDILR